MTKDKKEIARLIYDELKKGKIKSTIFTISKELEKEKTAKLQFIKTPLLNLLGQELGKLLLKEDWKFERLMELWKKGERDEKLIVISALGKISEKDYENSKEFLLKILNDVSDWEICDQLALRVIATLAIQNPREVFSLMEEWLKSDNKWIRRLAIATIPPYIRAKKEESLICLKFLNKVMREEDKDVKKAIGWALREVTKKDPDSVFEFLEKWAKIDDKNTKWIIKEGMKKLSKEKQERLKPLLN
ncbi:MAG: DNA alkylation repair protein [Patescibacteria group bacterium]|nr:DNA alkylation repair protein [Patescibacteria group bacterium]